MYRYRVTIESLSPATQAESVVFEVDNHDDLTAIANRLPSRFGLDTDSTKAMVIGAKLLGEVVLKKRTESPFSDLRPALRDFSQAMKKQAAEIDSD